jgi:hypothetical protein
VPPKDAINVYGFDSGVANVCPLQSLHFSTVSTITSACAPPGGRTCSVALGAH